MSAANVLVMDETRAVQSMLSQALAVQGFRVHGVRDAASARLAVVRDSYDVAILALKDSVREAAGGARELIREIARSCPVITIASGESMETRLEALRAGATDFVVAPYTPDYVVKRVQETTSSHRAVHSPYRILVVDDSLTYGHAVAHALSRAGHDVVVAISGHDADAYLALQRPDVIFLDVFLPDVDGIDLARRIRSAPGTRDIPILLLTGRESTNIRARAVAANVSDFAAKNVPLDELCHRVTALVGERLRLERPAGRVAERTGEPLFDRLVAASGLSAVLGRSTLGLALRRAGYEPSGLNPATLRTCLPQVQQTLQTFLPAGDVRQRMSEIETLTHKGEGIR